jgi:hypothetical protein
MARGDIDALLNELDPDASWRGATAAIARTVDGRYE